MASEDLCKKELAMSHVIVLLHSSLDSEGLERFTSLLSDEIEAFKKIEDEDMVKWLSGYLHSP